MSDNHLNITAVAKARLKASPYLPIRRIDCSCQSGSLVLRGSVPTFFHKQLAQRAVADIDGVIEVDNRIRVMD